MIWSMTSPSARRNASSTRARSWIAPDQLWLVIGVAMLWNASLRSSGYRAPEASSCWPRSRTA